MLTSIVAAAGLLAGWSIADLAIAIVIITGIVAVVWVAMGVFGVSPPPWALKILWIIVVAFIAIAAIRLLAAM